MPDASPEARHQWRLFLLFLYLFWMCGSLSALEKRGGNTVDKEASEETGTEFEGRVAGLVLFCRSVLRKLYAREVTDRTSSCSTNPVNNTSGDGAVTWDMFQALPI